jgi:ParB-like chromosome segregation protein Spo0J
LPGFHAHNRKKETATMKELRRREVAALAPRMSIVYRAVDQLKPEPANARRHSKKQLRQIAESIKIFGFNVPILTDREGKVVAGHGRLLACRLLGITEAPTLCLDHLTAAQTRAFMIADNRLTEIAAWAETDGRRRSSRRQRSQL